MKNKIIPAWVLYEYDIKDTKIYNLDKVKLKSRMFDIILFEYCEESFKFKFNKNKLNELISLEYLENDYNILNSYYPSEDEVSEIKI